MKFLCEQCKAKYQIADEKVAGKTVRMKCRKCGHLIEVRAEVTESSAIAHAPPAAPGTSRPGGPDGCRREARGTQGPGPAAAEAERRSRRASRPPSPPHAKAERSAGGALSGAFRNNVQREDEGSAPFDMADLAPGDDWYVAINGVPVGPIRIAEVRRKAALGAVTEESLVWQEGLDEWRPAQDVPGSRGHRPRGRGVGARVDHAAAARRAPEQPRRRRARRSMRHELGEQRAVARVASSRPLQTPATGRASNVVPITSRLATAERLDDAPTEIGALPQARRPRSPIPSPCRLLRRSLLAPPRRWPRSETGRRSSLRRRWPRRRGADARSRKQPPWIVIAMIAGAVAFGAVAALSIFIKPAPAPAPVAQGAAAPRPLANRAGVRRRRRRPPPTASPRRASPSPPPRRQRTAEPADARRGRTRGRARDARAFARSALARRAATWRRAKIPGAATRPRPPGQCISGGQVQQVIGLHQLAIRRTCWERNPTVKPTVNVSVSLTVGPDGSAQGVSASGDEPSVAKCIENDVRGWHFPAMGCSQKTGFSFKFVRQ